VSVPLSALTDTADHVAAPVHVARATGEPMLRKFDFWASRHRAGLATAALALFAAAVIASALDVEAAAAAAVGSALGAFIALAVGIRHASGGGDGGGGFPGIGDGGDC
jgi:D-serine deaminase-like pyridoxal phosphate-dependent protein